ncbi:general stress protein CsbD [Zymomonas mobilis subsp. mobilis ZM4 = ATCC 31821]|uniref:CsbD family protein n=1 Tax=Zymomonas mobilis subsp. mobilis (strain ATCC 31821 / ZM4 / CP4) TaxID=264203 RepID=Q5NPJ6_ZYMMO|nr:CsbD family protein [Zymomonas mobilis]AAV89364.1 CsbD family protein [Zymomonas mobilis subsp. mobilis ZM4 = ATCC 31821]ACV75082.1 CsbD family protein [Zymomonas mobilis subsp. mobilis NCIMB 11163]AHB09872.1 hypothetical protein ZCP4_0558 [Zymomonas mobilis subsp. mobilis str. CP4 = NRRL B-14023]AHJ70177.1 CsbD-like protein [Zymomonas mobilis subsp. mobilis NRRL B-12526]AHJ72032.1 CsbD-like protein [Zymomonas mobilis subsp. mobilis str. CP4 = NRRL B-14023]
MSGTYNKIKGTAQKAVGAGKEELGKAIDDPELQSKGILEQAQGAASKAFGNAKEAISDGIDKAKDALEDLKESAQEKFEDIKESVEKKTK